MTEREGRTLDGTADTHTRASPPHGYIAVPLGKGGCILILTTVEYVQAIARGKRWRRQEALRRRVEGSR
jgi:hypothetical protein